VEFLRMGGRVDYDTIFEGDAGIAAAAGGQWALAEQHFENALHTAQTAPHVPAQGEVRYWHAWMLLTRRAPGDVERARMMLAEALAHYERLGLPHRVRLCRTMLEQTAALL
jgi:hypothetical protein